LTLNKIGQANLSKKADKLKANMLVSCCYSSKIAAKINNILKKKRRPRKYVAAGRVLKKRIQIHLDLSKRQENAGNPKIRLWNFEKKCKL
jgi:hypothetical protein